MTPKPKDETVEPSSLPPLLFESLTYQIIGAFFAVYNALGHGFLENVYRNALVIELERRGLSVRREVAVEVLYLGQPVGTYRMDLVVEGKILIEIKASPTVGETERRQVSNYLCASGLPVGLLLHFGPKPWHKRFLAATDKSHVVFST